METTSEGSSAVDAEMQGGEGIAEGPDRDWFWDSVTVGITSVSRGAGLSRGAGGSDWVWDSETEGTTVSVAGLQGGEGTGNGSGSGSGSGDSALLKRFETLVRKDLVPEAGDVGQGETSSGTTVGGGGAVAFGVGGLLSVSTGERPAKVKGPSSGVVKLSSDEAI